jgi:hypothetical protein
MLDVANTTGDRAPRFGTIRAFFVRFAQACIEFFRFAGNSEPLGLNAML